MYFYIFKLKLWVILEIKIKSIVYITKMIVKKDKYIELTKQFANLKI